MSCHRTVTSRGMIPAFTDTGSTGPPWGSTAAVGAASPRTQPRVIIATAAIRAVRPVHFNIAASVARLPTRRARPLPVPATHGCRVPRRVRAVDSIHVREPLRSLSHGGGDRQEVITSFLEG